MKKNLVIFFLFLVLSNCGISSQFSINNTTDTPVQIDIISDEFHYTIDTLWQNSASDFKIMEEVFTQHNFSMKSCKALGGIKEKLQIIVLKMLRSVLILSSNLKTPLN